jgi:hypothetical protein
MIKINGQCFIIIIVFLFLSSCADIELTKDKGTQVVTKSAQEEEYTLNIGKGNLLVISIEQYKKDKGNYPNSLAELVPMYLSELPPTYAGDSFRYVKLIPSSLMNWDPYLISFDLSSENTVRCSYSPYYRYWECGPKNIPE